MGQDGGMFTKVLDSRVCSRRHSGVWHFSFGDFKESKNFLWRDHSWQNCPQAKFSHPLILALSYGFRLG